MAKVDENEIATTNEFSLLKDRYRHKNDPRSDTHDFVRERWTM